MSKVLFNEYLESDNCLSLPVATSATAPLPSSQHQTDVSVAYDNSAMAINALTLTSNTATTSPTTNMNNNNNFNFVQPNVYYENCNSAPNDSFLMNSSTDINFNDSFMMPKQMNYALNPNSSISSSSTSSLASSNPSSVYLSPAWYESLNTFNSGFFYPNIYENEYFLPRGKLIFNVFFLGKNFRFIIYFHV